MLLSGTPLQNSLKELWCLLNYVKPPELTVRKVFIYLFIFRICPKYRSYCNAVLVPGRKLGSSSQPLILRTRTLEFATFYVVLLPELLQS
jgi:SNF2 family DNA or RNA helicase